MNLKSTLLAVLAASALLVGAVGAVSAQPDETNDAGPPDDLPEPVPDFVGEILGAIGEFLSGVLSALGSVVSGLTPGNA